MKILFIHNFIAPDYQSDMIFHGARSLLGADCVDSVDAWHMYDDMRKYWNQRIPENGTTFGRGFTMNGKLPRLTVDRDDLPAKIRNHYFDKIVYGSITRCQDYFNDVLKHYKQSEVILVDGEDDQENRRFCFAAGNMGKYHKRELVNPHTENKINCYTDVLAYPINFCIPKELIVSSVPNKTQDWATIIPGDRSTYIFTDEASYYEDYRKSYFGVTIKKGGWDCLRHYEILMNGCIPYFPGLEGCPELTMTKFPRKLILETNKKVDSGENILSFYDEYVNMLLDYTRKNLTTEVVAKEIIGI